jgi:hypothetical protein
MTTPKKLKIVFDPNCFDNFEGTQEELDAFVAELTAMAESGELDENSREITDEDWEEMPDDAQQKLLKSLQEFYDNNKRNLH